MTLLKLDNAPVGSTVKVISFHGGYVLQKKLAGIGINRGDLLRIDVNRGAGPLMIYHVSLKVRFALGRGISSRIEVELYEV